MRETDLHNKKLLNLYPYYAIVPTVFDLVFHWVMYYGGRYGARLLYHVILGREFFSFHLPADDLVPFQPGWVWYYYTCIAVWALTYISLSRRDEDAFYRFISTQFWAKLIMLPFLLFLPTTLVRPELGEGISSWMLSVVYAIDAPDNLFPSLHIICGWCVFRCVADVKKVPVWLKIVQFISFAAVMWCILAIRQHVMMDIAGGVIISEIGFAVAKKHSIRGVLEKMNEKAKNLLTKD